MSIPLQASRLLAVTVTVAGMWAQDGATVTSLPPPSGPYVVGTRVFHWTDTGRPEICTSDPSDEHPIAAQLWYPGEGTSGSKRAPYVLLLDEMMAAVRADPRAPANLTQDLGSYSEVETNAFLDAPIRSGRRWPVVLMSPGGNMSRHWYTAHMEGLASHGYAVVAVSHAHSGWDVFPGVGFLRSSSYWQAPASASAEDRKQLDTDLSDYLAADAIFVLDRLGEINNAVFGGALDLSRVGIMGHSRGGKTVSRACSSEPRFLACLILDNVGPEPERNTGLTQPLMTVRASQSRWAEERVDSLRRYLRAGKSRNYEVVIDGANHFTFSDLPILSSQTYPSQIEPKEGLRLALACTRAFFDVHLRGREALRLDRLGEIHPEITVRRFPE